ncbi:Hypp8195 [Branchiostoma lanceolatum]|uniref:Hypp8195 protein n=1 Tax=Branchiostoma lanceolatum TaxID=7740 RepID=A0A8J9Z687_BRALA|nr:Hypp8195 [Branchiostoma lanceolatum]
MADPRGTYLAHLSIYNPEILRQIDKLSEYAIDVKVPDTVEELLDQIGLEQYNDKFVYDAYDVASLVNLEEQQIRENLGIVKTAHVKRMLVAISHLRHPRESKYTEHLTHVPYNFENAKDMYAEKTQASCRQCCHVR